MEQYTAVWFKQILRVCFVLLAMLFVATLGFSTVKAFAVEHNDVTGPAGVKAAAPVDSTVKCWAFLSAAISTGFGIIGAGIAVAHVGAAALGTIGERPELAGRALIFVGLAEGLAILGLLTAILILNQI